MAVLFDGDDYLVTSRMTDTEGQAGLTVGGWFYVTADRDHWCVCKGLSKALNNVLLWCDDVGGPGTPVNPSATNTWAFNMGNADTGTDRINGTAGLRQLNTWQHVVGVMSGRFRGLYFNGVLNASHSSASTTSTFTNVAANYRIGDWQPLASNRLGGMAADVFVYPAALSSDQIAMIYALRRVPWSIVAGCECYLPLMGPTGAAVNTAHWGTKDLSGNGNHVASVKSAPVWADDPLPPQAWVDGWFGGAWAAGGAVITPRRPPMVHRSGPRMILGGVI
jgi:hypothetical protein